MFANLTKSTGSCPPFFFRLFKLLRMVRLLPLELLRETLRTRFAPGASRRNDIEPGAREKTGLAGWEGKMACTAIMAEGTCQQPDLNEPRQLFSRKAVDPDAALVEQLRRQDAAAPEALVAAYWDPAYRLAIRITGNASDAEEVVQDALWTVSRKIDTFRGLAPSALGCIGSPPIPPTRSYGGGAHGRKCHGRTLIRHSRTTAGT